MNRQQKVFLFLLVALTCIVFFESELILSGNVRQRVANFYDVFIGTVDVPLNLFASRLSTEADKPDEDSINARGVNAAFLREEKKWQELSVRASRLWPSSNSSTSAASAPFETTALVVYPDGATWEREWILTMLFGSVVRRLDLIFYSTTHPNASAVISDVSQRMKNYPRRVPVIFVLQALQSLCTPQVAVAAALKPDISILLSDEYAKSRCQHDGIPKHSKVVFRQYAWQQHKGYGPHPNVWNIPLGVMAHSFPARYEVDHVPIAYSSTPVNILNSSASRSSLRCGTRLDVSTADRGLIERSLSRRRSDLLWDNATRNYYSLMHAPVLERPFDRRVQSGANDDICNGVSTSTERSVAHQLLAPRHRPYVWSFFGGLKQDRERMRDAFATVHPHHAEYLSQAQLGRAIHDRMEAANNYSAGLPISSVVASELEQMTRFYRMSTFVPVGRGWKVLDCFRIYEASRAGAIPIVIPRSIDEFRRAFGHFIGVEGLLPVGWVVASSWHRAAAAVRAITGTALERRQDDTLRFWETMLLATRVKILETLLDVAERGDHMT